MGGDGKVPSLAFNGQLAHDRIATVSRVGDAVGDKACSREIFGVEPCLGGDLLVCVARPCVHAGEFNIKIRLGDIKTVRVEVQLRREVPERAVHLHAHLLVAEVDGALVTLDLVVTVGCGGHDREHCYECDDFFHFQPFREV